MRGFAIRLGTEKDLGEMTRQRHMMFEDMGRGTAKGLGVHDRSFPDWARREMRAKRLVTLLVEAENGRIVGGGTLWLREVQPYPGFPGGKVPYLMSMYTHPDFRRRGIGGMVVKATIAWCRRNGYRSMTLHASKMGRSLYRKMGWERSGEMELDL